ncbi:ion transporter [Aliiroseovarius sp. F47248L]|uniref:ion transporter n=1 Tax=Aliiroseovarius sp. F47248L TaxID=2926420 RepID=UPI001FF65565|nr:ion transporter [Aliiroseovarius sp. F47248L]MCK0137644.1 ion transporter [Aliiroseovarius sp. F47248L]
MIKPDIHEILDGHKPLGGVNVGRIMDGLIVLSAVAIALETMPELPANLRRLLFTFEIGLLAVFSVEYIVRLVSAPRPLRYAFSFWGIIDLLSIAPAIAFLTPQWQVVRTFRLLRLVRLLKLFRGSHAMERLVVAFGQVREELAVFGVIAGLMLYVSAVGIYVFEHDAQPEVFSSIPNSLWWAVASFTTVGYGDMFPITPGGRIFTTFVLFIGLGVIAVPSAIVTAALLESETNIQRRIRENAENGDEDEPETENPKSAQSIKGE